MDWPTKSEKPPLLLTNQYRKPKTKLEKTRNPHKTPKPKNQANNWPNPQNRKSNGLLVNRCLTEAGRSPFPTQYELNLTTSGRKFESETVTKTYVLELGSREVN